MDTLSSFDKPSFWSAFLSLIEERITDQSFSTWFKPLCLVEFTDNTLFISVPKPYYSSWLEEHYMNLIMSSVEIVLGHSAAVKFVVADQSEDPPPVQSETADQEIIEDSTDDFKIENIVINPRFSFDSFVIGNSNQFAHAASKAVAESPGNTAFNPLVIYSGVGLGKTHLLQAIANHCYKTGNVDNDKNRVIFISSEKFTMDFIMSIQNNLTPQYSTYYRNASLLLVDDIQFFNNKERTQEEFFHIFNALHQSGKQIVLTMDRPPAQLKGLADRLINRFQWGLVCDIQPPDFETRVAILKKKAEADGVYLDNSITDFIAENITMNIRELEGSLIRLLAYSSLCGQDISLEIATRVLSDTIKKSPSIITIEYIQKLVAEYFSIKPDIIIGNSRRKEVAIARHIAMFLCKQLTDSSLKTIGLHFGRRDHSTVIHSLRTVENKYLNDSSLSKHIDILTEKAKSS